MTTVNRNQPQAHHSTNTTHGVSRGGERAGDADLFHLYLRQPVKCCGDAIERLGHVHARPRHGGGQGQGDGQESNQEEAPFATPGGESTTRTPRTSRFSSRSDMTDAFGDFITTLLDEYRKSVQDRSGKEKKLPALCKPRRDQEHALVKDFAKELARDLVKEIKKELHGAQQCRKSGNTGRR